jgi:hypothetical protein
VSARRLAAVLFAVAGLIFIAVPPATASCATDSPAPSPDSFVGTIIGTDEDGRVAEVITDGGQEVTVLGTEHPSEFSNSYSSVDRRYALGGRYEFHPLNDESPYRDNACTATKQISGPPLPESEVERGFLPAWLPVDAQAGPVGYLMFFGPLFVGVIAVAALARAAMRMRRQTPKSA